MKKLWMICLLALTAIYLFGCGGKNLRAKEGEAANGFLWENNYSEISITGYQGPSNRLEIPQSINQKPVTKISANAFENFEALEEVVIPGSVKTIERSFNGCRGLKKLVIEEGVERMPYAFLYCTSLQEVVIPSTVTNLTVTFKGCRALEKVEIRSKKLAYVQETFEECPNLKEIEIPEEALQTILQQTEYSMPDESWEICEEKELDFYDKFIAYAENNKKDPDVFYNVAQFESGDYYLIEKENTENGYYAPEEEIQSGITIQKEYYAAVNQSRENAVVLCRTVKSGAIPFLTGAETVLINGIVYRASKQ